MNVIYLLEKIYQLSSNEPFTSAFSLIEETIRENTLLSFSQILGIGDKKGDLFLEEIEPHRIALFSNITQRKVFFSPIAENLFIFDYKTSLEEQEGFKTLVFFTILKELQQTIRWDSNTLPTNLERLLPTFFPEPTDVFWILFFKDLNYTQKYNELLEEYESKNGELKAGQEQFIRESMKMTPEGVL